MPSLDRPLSGRTVLVTGASGGIGAAIVERIALEGGRPIIHYGRDKVAADRLLDRIEGSGFAVQANLSDPSGAVGLWTRAAETAGRIHGLVNNAGIRTEISVDAPADVWREAWLKEFQVNFFAAVDLSREAIRHFKAHGGGHIVNMASRAGQRGYSADAMPYGATKAALLNFTKSVARSFGQDGVIAVAVAPGWVRTEMVADLLERHGEEAAVADIPIGRMAQPADVAELVAFALRPSQASLNGATLDVNGGSYIR